MVALYEDGGQGGTAIGPVLMHAERQDVFSHTMNMRRSRSKGKVHKSCIVARDGDIDDKKR